MSQQQNKRVSFMDLSDKDASTSKRPCNSHSGENKNMDPEVAKTLFENGAFLILMDVPLGTEIGIDMQTWRSGPEFKGIKMIPSGLHFVYWSSVSKEGSVGPRTGFFHYFAQKEIVAKRFNPKIETFEDSFTEEDIERFRINLKDMDRHLGAYPYDLWKKWVSLSSRISNDTIARLEPPTGFIQSVTELLPCSQDEHMEEQEMSNNCQTIDEREENLLPNMKVNPKGAIRYTTIPKRKHPSGSTPAQITKYNMDSSYQLESFLKQYQKRYGDQVSNSMSDKNQVQEILAELQFSFLCFLVGQHYDSFEHWKRLLIMLCTCEDAIVQHPQLYLNLISELYFQIKEVPNDFFVDIVSSSNFLATILNQMFCFIRQNKDRIEPQLTSRVEKFAAHLSQKFSWIFDDEEDEDDKPVIVTSEVENSNTQSENP